MADPCCDLHGRNCEPPSELCCENCTERTHPNHADGSVCVAPDVSGVGPAEGDSEPEPWMPVGCPDDGTCHHRCTNTCFRVICCEPLSGVYPDDDWPRAVINNPLPLADVEGEEAR